MFIVLGAVGVSVGTRLLVCQLQPVSFEVELGDTPREQIWMQFTLLTHYRGVGL